MAPVKIAVIGFGAIGRRHAEFVRSGDQSELVAVFGRTRRGAEDAGKFGVPFYTDLDRMLDETKPDGVIDATPTPEHLRIGLACARRGISLLVEKPIALTIGEGKALIEAAKQAGIKLLVGHHRRHNALFQEARALVKGGALGELRMVVSHFTALKPDAYYQEKWRAQAGQGPLPNNLIHELDALRFVCGEIESLHAFTSSTARGLPFTDTLSVSLRFASGALGVVAMSDSVTSPWAFEITAGEDPGFPRNSENYLRLMGAAGSLAFPYMDIWTHPEGRRLGWRGPLECKRLQVPPANPLERQVAHFCRVIRGEEEPLVSGEDGLRSLATVIAIDESGRRGAPVSPASLLN